MKRIEIKESVKIGDVILKEGTEIKVLPKLSESIEDDLKKAIRQMTSEQIDSLGKKDVHYEVGNSLGWLIADLYGSLYGSRGIDDFISGMLAGLEED